MKGKVKIWSLKNVPIDTCFVEITNDKKFNEVGIYYWSWEDLKQTDKTTVAIMYPKGSKPK